MVVGRIVKLLRILAQVLLWLLLAPAAGLLQLVGCLLLLVVLDRQGGGLLFWSLRFVLLRCG